MQNGLRHPTPHASLGQVQMKDVQRQLPVSRPKGYPQGGPEAEQNRWRRLESHSCDLKHRNTPRVHQLYPLTRGQWHPRDAQASIFEHPYRSLVRLLRRNVTKQRS